MHEESGEARTSHAEHGGYARIHEPRSSQDEPARRSLEPCRNSQDEPARMS